MQVIRGQVRPNLVPVMMHLPMTHLQITDELQLEQNVKRSDRPHTAQCARMELREGCIHVCMCGCQRQGGDRAPAGPPGDS